MAAFITEIQKNHMGLTPDRVNESNYLGQTATHAVHLEDAEFVPAPVVGAVLTATDLVGHMAWQAPGAGTLFPISPTVGFVLTATDLLGHASFQSGNDSIQCDANDNLLLADATAGAGSSQDTVFGCDAGASAPLTTDDITLIGYRAGFTNANSNVTAVGAFAGEINQGTGATALGFRAGETTQGANAIAIGVGAGQTTQGTSATAIGLGAGQTTQGNFAVAIGGIAGLTNQGLGSVALGNAAAVTNQGINAVAIANTAGNTGQGNGSVAIGFAAAQTNQGTESVALGLQAGQTTQAAEAIAIGTNAGNSGQGANAIAIGQNAGFAAQAANSIVLNATGLIFPAAAAATYVAPVRTTAVVINSLVYDPVTFEVTYNAAKTFVIPHPSDPDRLLVHACLEGPESGIYYRGTGEIKADQEEKFSVIQLPEYVQKLGFDYTIQLTSIAPETPLCYPAHYCSKVDEKSGSFKVYGTVGEFFWLVHAKRGEIEVEPKGDISDVKNVGPYTWLPEKQ